MKDALAYFIGDMIDELQDGFINGYSDVVVFFRENFKKLLAAGAGPEMGMFLGSFGTDQIMTYVTAGYKRYSDNKDRIRAAAKN